MSSEVILVEVNKYVQVISLRVNSWPPSRSIKDKQSHNTGTTMRFVNEFHQHGYIPGHDYGCTSSCPNPMIQINGKPSKATRQHCDRRGLSGHPCHGGSDCPSGDLCLSLQLMSSPFGYPAVPLYNRPGLHVSDSNTQPIGNYKSKQ